MKVNKLSLISLLIFSVVGYSSSSLAVTPANGTTTTQTTSKAMSFDQIKMAAQSGDADAQYALGYMYYYGKSGAPKDVVEAKKWISKAASQKQPQAEKALALMNRQVPSQVVNQSANSTQTSAPVANSQVPANSAPMVNDQATQQQPRPASAQNTSKGFADRAFNANKETALREKVATESNEKMSLVQARTQSSNNNEDKNSTPAGTKSSSNEHKSLIKEATKEAAKEPSSVGEHEGLNGNFTLQLLGSHHRDLVVKEMKAKHLGNKAKIYQTTFNNKDWFVLLYGRYDSKTEANEVKKSLESQFDLKPWVKPTATLKTYKKLSD